MEISYTHNIFSSFAFGIQKGPFPFTISIRKQNENFIVLDDLLSLTPVHLNVLPTSAYIPDWISLIAQPARSLELIDAMFDHCWQVVEEQFWPNRDKLFKDSDKLSLKELKECVIAGFNFPPSQYQLHLQFMIPPFLPFQWLACHKGVHFTKARFFPFPYVRKLLQCDSHFEWKEDSSVEQLMEFYKEKHNLDYEVIHSECYKKYFEIHNKLAKWNAEDFEGIVGDGVFYKFQENGDIDFEKGEEVKADAIAGADKLTLQNYGRPYDNGKPKGTYYKYAKKQLKFY